MDDIMRQLKGEIARLRAQSGRGELRLFEHVGSRVLNHLSVWRDSGMSYSEIARQLGISDTSIHGWRRRAGLLPVQGTATPFVQVEVQAPKSEPVQVAVSQPPLTLLCPSGHQLLGLDLSAALTLIRALS